MYKRDVAVVLLACIAILVSIQHEGTFSYRKAWQVQLVSVFGWASDLSTPTHTGTTTPMTLPRTCMCSTKTYLSQWW